MSMFEVIKEHKPNKVGDTDIPKPLKDMILSHRL